MRTALRFATVSAVAMGVALSSPAFAATDASIDKLSALLEKQAEELQSLKSQLATLKKDQAKTASKVDTVAAAAPAKAAAAPKGAVAQGSFPGSIQIPGTDVSFKIGGQVKADLSYTPNQTTGLNEFLFQPRTIAAGSTPHYGHTNFQARDTRLNVDARTTSDYGDIKAFVEFDLFGQTAATASQNQFNGYDLRLRHAYVSVGEWLVGQTWSNFDDLSANPETLDFAQLNSVGFLRQAQVRWTHKLDDHNSVAVALENPEADISNAAGSAALPGKDTYPDLTANLRTEQDWGSVQLGGVLRALETRDAGTPDDSETGYGVSLTTKIKTNVFSDKDNIRAGVSFGQGIGRYINDLQASGSATGGYGAFVNGSGDVEALSSVGAYASYQAVFSPKWRSNVMGGYIRTDAPDAVAGAMDKEYMGVVNLIWSPLPKFDTGIEAIWGKRENNDGTDGNATRFTVAAKYSF